MFYLRVPASLRENDPVPAPKLRHEATGLWIEFPLKKQVGKGKTSEKTSEKTPVKILRILKEQPDLALADLASQVARTPRAIEMACAKLLKEGKLRRVGPAKGGHWEVLG
jgi:ATP-dependent DNA helicase RecG